jgi:hypothetical protein
MNLKIFDSKIIIISLTIFPAFALSKDSDRLSQNNSIFITHLEDPEFSSVEKPANESHNEKVGKYDSDRFSNHRHSEIIGVASGANDATLPRQMVSSNIAHFGMQGEKTHVRDSDFDQ